MKIVLSILSLLYVIGVNAQQSEDLVPQEAASVFSINNINLLQKVSLDQLVQYEFMEEVQQELFDGSTSGKTIKDSGIDFDQKLNIFMGQADDYLVSGLTFGIVNKNQLFEVFDDFEPIESNYAGVEFYSSYFNRIAIKGNLGILYRVLPTGNRVDDLTDSIWYAQGNGYRWDDHYYDDDYYYDENYEGWTREESEIEFTEDMETEENTTTPIDEEDNLPEAADDPTIKTYYELRDSVEMALQNEFMNAFCENIFVKGNVLTKTSPEFKNQLNSQSEGTFFIDNSKNLKTNRDFAFMKRRYPSLYDRINELYTGNTMSGEIHINDNSIEMDLETKYSEKLGSVYKEMTDSKFDKSVLKYIPEDNQSFFTYNVDLRKAYEEAFKVILPIFSESESREFSTIGLTFELLDEFMNKDALFNSYKGSMFGSFNGIKKVQTTKIIWDYDDETFDYIEKEVEAEEDMPVFVFGFSTDRHDIPEKIMKHLCKHMNTFHNMGDYYMVDDAVMNASPLYIINKNGLFIYTNDESLAKNNSDGYGKNAISKKQVKKGMKGGAVYLHADLSKAIAELPKEIFNGRENEMIDVFRGKSGSLELSSSKSTKSGTSFNLSYQFEGEYDNSGTYILDLINSMYVISK
jgi:hypothetical protein